MSLLGAERCEGGTAVAMPSALTSGHLLEGGITPITLILTLILANRRSLLGPAANGPMGRRHSIVSVAGWRRSTWSKRFGLLRPGMSAVVPRRKESTRVRSILGTMPHTAETRPEVIHVV
jgi:hypothetical protein